MRNHMIAAAALALTVAGGSSANAGPCADQIKQLQESATKTDVKNKPGQQAQPTDTGSARTQGSDAAGGVASKSGEKSAAAAPADGGGTQSANAKILEAQAHDGRGDEANCMKAVEEAKKLIDG